MNRYTQLSRAATILIVTLIGMLVYISTARAVVTTTTANAAIVGYNLGSGANSGAIVPPASQSVLVMGCCNTVGFRGVGQVSLLRVPGSFLEWVGLNSTSGAAITQGFSGTAGTDILFIDFSHQVVIEVNTTDSFRVHNGSGGARAGNVTLIW